MSGLLSEERIEAIARQAISDHEQHRGESDVIRAIRTAIREAGEAAAKVADEFNDPEQVATIAAAIRAKL